MMRFKTSVKGLKFVKLAKQWNLFVIVVHKKALKTFQVILNVIDVASSV